MGSRKQKPSGNHMGDIHLEPIRFEAETPWGKILISKDPVKDLWSIIPESFPLYHWAQDGYWTPSPSPSFHWSELPAQLAVIKEKPFMEHLISPEASGGS